MLNYGFQNAMTAAIISFIIFVVIPKSCGGEVNQEAAEAEACTIVWTGRGYEVQCEETGE